MPVRIDYYLLSASRRAHRLLPGKVYVIGREAGVDITLQDVLISRRHAELQWKDETWHLVDLGSRNGVFVNGEKVVGSRALKDLDRLQIGGHVFNLQLAPAGSDVGALAGQAPTVANEVTLAPGMNLADIAAQGSAFAGKLGPGGSLELLQFLAQTRKTGRFDLLGSFGLVGSVWVKDGAACEALFRMQEGFDGLLTLLRQPADRFAFHAGDAPAHAPSIRLPAEAVLMELARRLDESRKPG